MKMHFSKYTLLLLSCILFTTVSVNAQKIAIGVNTPQASSSLEVYSTTTGVLVPRMTSAQRTAIGSPATGLLVYDTNSNSFWYYNGTAWTDIGSGGNTLDEAYDEGGAGVGRTITADNGSVLIQGADGLQVTGSHGSGAALGLSGAGTRMFFYPKKSAFRAGYVGGTEWNDANIGNYSFASGRQTIASNNHTTSIGYGSHATGENSSCIGVSDTASGQYATAIGNLNLASGANALAAGVGSVSSGDNATALGSGATASGNYSLAALGGVASGGSAVAINGSTSSGLASNSIGASCVASNSYATSVGYGSHATAGFSSCFGVSDTASGQYATAIGHLNLASGAN
ncbi:MAG: hypothetical protein GY751_18885, partial [Bacteroidetes bacterium]|nr:hypothetical protein [Bacteroidota bacterium]